MIGLAKKNIISLISSILSLAFDRRYLKGKYFDSAWLGWKWVLQGIFIQKILRINYHVPWPVSIATRVDEPNGIYFDPDDMQNFMHYGCYYSNANGGVIQIGKGTWIAPNVGIITTNHDIYDLSKHSQPKNVTLGKNCWIGMNSVILPGVELGENTIVGAGSVVTKSFAAGHVVIAGNPAKVIKILNEK